MRDDYYSRVRIDGKPAKWEDVDPARHRFDQLYFIGFICYEEFSSRTGGDVNA